jgi:hypothetical protein
LPCSTRQRFYLALLPNARGLIQARLCLRGGFSCFGNIARALRIPIPEDADPSDGISLSYEEFLEAIERLRRVDFPIERPVEDAWADFLGWRVNYEAAAYALALATDAPPALWSGPRRHEMEAIPPFGRGRPERENLKVPKSPKKAPTSPQLRRRQPTVVGNPTKIPRIR